MIRRQTCRPSFHIWQTPCGQQEIRVKPTGRGALPYPPYGAHPRPLNTPWTAKTSPCRLGQSFLKNKRRRISRRRIGVRTDSMSSGGLNVPSRSRPAEPLKTQVETRTFAGLLHSREAWGYRSSCYSRAVTRVALREDRHAPAQAAVSMTTCPALEDSSGLPPPDRRVLLAGDREFRRSPHSPHTSLW